MRRPSFGLKTSVQVAEASFVEWIAFFLLIPMFSGSGQPAEAAALANHSSPQIERSEHELRIHPPKDPNLTMTVYARRPDQDRGPASAAPHALDVIVSAP